MTKLEAARQKLKEAENTLARFQGEETVLLTQLAEAREELAGLGIAEEEAPRYLAKLEAEEKALVKEISELEQKLAQSLEQKAAPQDLGGASESLLTTLNL